MEIYNNIDNGLNEMLKDYLESAGVHVDTDLSAFDSSKEGYIKIDKSIVGKVDSIMQYLPQIVLNKSYSNDVFRVIYDKGIGVLQKSAQHPGMFLGNVVLPDANNKIRDVALLEELSMKPKLFNGIFSTMSMITGQYYMAQINHNLEKIEKSVAVIYQFMENDKKSRLESEGEFLNQVQQMLPFILNNKLQRQSTVTSIQKIKIDSLTDINFYKKQIIGLIKKEFDIKKDKEKEIEQNIQKAISWISEYWYSLYLYNFSSCLEPVVAQNFDSDYLAYIKADVKEKSDKYVNDYNIWVNELKEYISSAEAFKGNELLKGVGNIGTNKVGGNWGIALTSIGICIVANTIVYFDEKWKAKKQKEVQDSLSKGIVDLGIEPIEYKQNELALFESLYNGRVELVKNKEEMYIKVEI